MIEYFLDIFGSDFFAGHDTLRMTVISCAMLAAWTVGLRCLFNIFSDFLRIILHTKAGE